MRCAVRRKSFTDARFSASAVLLLPLLLLSCCPETAPASQQLTGWPGAVYDGRTDGRTAASGRHIGQSVDVDNDRALLSHRDVLKIASRRRRRPSSDVDGSGFFLAQFQPRRRPAASVSSLYRTAE